MKNLVARITYDSEFDAYNLMVSHDGGEEYSLATSVKCQFREGDIDEEPMYIHCYFVEEVIRAVKNGFKLVQ